jgi:hypothetical protein
MEMKILPPRMKDRQKSHRRAPTPGVSRNREQRFGCGAEQDVVDLACILQRQPADLLRQRKHNVEIGNRQQLGFPRCQPLRAQRCLTLWVVGVIRDDAMAARIALLHILQVAAESSRAAVANRCEGFSLLGVKNMPPLCEEVFLVSAEDIGHLGPIVHRVGGTSFPAPTRSSEPSISNGLLVERMAASLTCR